MITPSTNDPGGDTLTPLRDLRRFERSFVDGDVIFASGSHGSCMYVVVEGRVDIHGSDVDGARLLTSLGPGASFGEIALVDGGTRTAAARAAATPTRLVEIDKARFVYLVGQQPAFALTVLRGLARRVEALSHRQPPEDAPP